MTDLQRRIARARLLRREGKTYDEIRAVVGDVSDDRLQTWLVGIPRPAATRRSHPKDDLRRECRRLRALGLTYDEIAEKTGASKGSISPWVRDVATPEEVRLEHRRRLVRARSRAGASQRRSAAARREGARAIAADTFGVASQRDLFVAGLALYWAEGQKDKPWRRNGRVTFINSDVSVLRLFLDWLDLVGVPEADRVYRLNIHETADVARNERWWAQQLEVPLASFARATIKRHKPVTVRLNTGEHYHGCLVVSVAKSGRLYYSIEGWWGALTGADRL